MKSILVKRTLAFCLALALLVGFAPSLASPMEAAQTPPPGNYFASQALKQQARDAYLKLPLYFIANQGQMDGRVGYYVQGGGHSLYFTAEEMVMALDETTLRMRFVGAKATPPLGVEKTTAKVNHLIGNDPAQWQTDIPTYSQVVYHELYPGIDLRYEGQTGALKYTFVVQPGADPSQIRLAYGGAAGLHLDEAGNLLILVGGSELKDTRPYAYQEIGGRRVEVGTEFVLHGVRTCGFAVRSDYDPRYPLIIDPTLVYSTYLGGTAGDSGSDIAVDGAGHAYVTGSAGGGFPTKNAYQTYGGAGDAFVAKMDTTKSGNASLVYSTYLGGFSPDFGSGIAVDGAGNAYVTGTTSSTNFPTKNQYQLDQPGDDAFVTKLNPAGNTLLYSTYLGGNIWDIGHGIAVDGAGHAYVTGQTTSTNFPIQNQYQTDQLGWDAFVTKIDPTKSGAASLIYSTYLGGGDSDLGHGIAVDGSGNAYVTGSTASNNFPTQNPCQGTYGGGAKDVFVTKLNAAGNLPLYSTYLGGSGWDDAWDLALGEGDQVYVTGVTQSTDFPTKNPYQGTYGGGYTDVIVAKVDTAQSGNASLAYSTYLGGGDWDVGNGIAVDGAGRAYVTGQADSSDFPTQNAYQGDQGGRDGFVTKFNAAGNDLLYSTYLGGSDSETGSGIAVDGIGHAYVTGGTSSTDFPIRNAYQGTHGGATDAFVTKLGVLSIGKSDFPDPVLPGGLITYTIFVSETGGLLDATGMQVTDTVPVSTTCCADISYSGTLVGNDVAWSGLTISKGQSINLTFVVTVNHVPSGTIITNNAYRVVTSTQGTNTGLGSTVTTTVQGFGVYLPTIQRSYTITP